MKHLQTKSLLFLHTFSLPPWWSKVTLVQLCPDEYFQRIIHRFKDFNLETSVILKKDSLVDTENVIGVHSRPTKSSRPFSEYINAPLFEAVEKAGVVFVVHPENLTSSHTCDEFLDLFDDIYRTSKGLVYDHAAIIDHHELWWPWRKYFQADEVMLPTTGETITVPCMLARSVKQKILNAAYVAAQDGPIVEIGRLWGGSAVLFGLGAKAVGAKNFVFSFDPFPHQYNQRLLELYGVEDVVALLDISSEEGYVYWKTEGLPAISLIHIDGDHRYEAVKKDIEMWTNLVRKGGMMMFDDYSHPLPSLVGSTRAIFEGVAKKSENWKNLQVLDGSLSAVRI